MHIVLLKFVSMALFWCDTPNCTENQSDWSPASVSQFTHSVVLLLFLRMFILSVNGRQRRRKPSWLLLFGYVLVNFKYHTDLGLLQRIRYTELQTHITYRTRCSFINLITNKQRLIFPLLFSNAHQIYEKYSFIAIPSRCPQVASEGN